MNVLHHETIPQKLLALDSSIERALAKDIVAVPQIPGRDVPVLPVRETRGRMGLSKKEGIASLLHLTANIELQAMEIGFRSLLEFPEAANSFREQLAQVVKEEGEHLALCIEELESLGFKWGDFSINTGLWDATDASDSFLDRILIVHCYLEGSGLDAQETIMRRLIGVNQKGVSTLMEKIFMDEKKHVRFGIESYSNGCREAGLDADIDFVERAFRLQKKLPRRLEKPSSILRQEVGFSVSQAQVIERIHKTQKS